MGFRSTFVTQGQGGGVWPAWFVEKYRDLVHFSDWGHGPCGPLSSRREAGFYCDFSDFLEDIRRAYPWDPNYGRRPGSDPQRFFAVFLHDCGGVTRVRIQKDGILFSEPNEWDATSGVTHSDACDYCGEDPSGYWAKVRD